MNPKRKQMRRFSGSNPEVARPRGKIPKGKASTFNMSTDGRTRDRTHHQAHLLLLHPTHCKESKAMSSNSCPICPDQRLDGPTRQKQGPRPPFLNARPCHENQNFVIRSSREPKLHDKGADATQPPSSSLVSSPSPSIERRTNINSIHQTPEISE